METEIWRGQGRPRGRSKAPFFGRNVRGPDQKSKQKISPGETCHPKARGTSRSKQDTKAELEAKLSARVKSHSNAHAYSIRTNNILLTVVVEGKGREAIAWEESDNLWTA